MMEQPPDPRGMVYAALARASEARRDGSLADQEMSALMAYLPDAWRDAEWAADLRAIASQEEEEARFWGVVEAVRRALDRNHMWVPHKGRVPSPPESAFDDAF